MLKKLTALSLSLLICLSLLPSQAGAMDASENELPVQAEDVENWVSPEDADAGIAPCGAVWLGPVDGGGLGVGIGGGDSNGSGGAWGPGAGAAP